MLPKNQIAAIYPRVSHQDIFITVLAPTPLPLIQSGRATNTWVSLEMAPSTDRAPTPLQVATNTSVNTKMANPTDKAPTSLQAAANTSVNTKMANPTDKAPTPLLMEEEMLANSKTVF